MTVTDLPPVTIVRDLTAIGSDRWRRARSIDRTRVQVAIFLVVVVGAYHYSLTTLVQSLNLDTPLAYIGLVPFIALGMAGLRSHRRAAEPAIYDRQVDFIVGVPLIAAAVAMNLLLPGKLSTMFWLWRVDLLSLPFFVAGVVSIIFGVRALWRQRLATAYLFLIWPLPYSVVLLRDLNAFTSVTLAGLQVALHFVHFATPAHVADGSVFNVLHQGQYFQISVVSACSGVNGMVGFTLVGTAFGVIVKGSRLRKALWLGTGLIMLWAFNVARLLLIFWAGRTYGEHFALKVLHPFVGLITFNVGVLVMLLLLTPFGLRIPIGRRSDRRNLEASGATPPGRSTLAVPSIYSAVAVVVVSALVLGTANSRLRAYDLVARATGEPKLASFLDYPASPQGWAPVFATEYDWAKPYFGESSKWYRYVFNRTVGGDLPFSYPVTADIINTNDLSSFSAYGVEACYRFHGYHLRSVSQVGLGGGVTGETMSYVSSDREHQDWSIVYWIWPVKAGDSTRYERIILYVLNGTGLSDSAGPQAVQRQLAQNRGFLVAFARQIVQSQTKVRPGALFKRTGPSGADSPMRQWLQSRAQAAKASSGTETAAREATPNQAPAGA